MLETIASAGGSRFKGIPDSSILIGISECCRQRSRIIRTADSNYAHSRSHAEEEWRWGGYVYGRVGVESSRVSSLQCDPRKAKFLQVLGAVAQPLGLLLALERVTCRSDLIKEADGQSGYWRFEKPCRLMDVNSRRFRERRYWLWTPIVFPGLSSR